MMEIGANVIEQCLLMLPECHKDSPQRSYIEICTFNGLLTTRKVIGMCVVSTSTFFYSLLFVFSLFSRQLFCYASFTLTQNDCSC